LLNLHASRDMGESDPRTGAGGGQSQESSTEKLGSGEKEILGRKNNKTVKGRCAIVEGRYLTG